MKKLLHEIYFSELEKGYAPNSEYVRALEKTETIEDEIRKNLPEALRRRLDDFSQAHRDAAAVAGEESFIMGYRAGAKLMMAAVGNFEPDPLLK